MFDAPVSTLDELGYPDFTANQLARTDHTLRVKVYCGGMACMVRIDDRDLRHRRPADAVALVRERVVDAAERIWSCWEAL